MLSRDRCVSLSHWSRDVRRADSSRGAGLDCRSEWNTTGEGGQVTFLAMTPRQPFAASPIRARACGRCQSASTNTTALIGTDETGMMLNAAWTRNAAG